MVLADTSGNIGYALFSSNPIRKGDYPNLGCRAFDGTTSKHDWQGLVEFKNLPFVLNPAKGYYYTANQRLVPENSKFDIGATQVNTGRALRIDEMIKERIKSGKKMDAQDMVDMQQDMVDVVARDLVPSIVRVTNKVIEEAAAHGFEQGQVEDMK